MTNTRIFAQIFNSDLYMFFYCDTCGYECVHWEKFDHKTKNDKTCGNFRYSGQIRCSGSEAVVETVGQCQFFNGFNWRTTAPREVTQTAKL